MKNNLFEVDRSEKNRILEMHTKASKLNYLFESGDLSDPTIQDIINMINTCHNLSEMQYIVAPYLEGFDNLSEDMQKKMTDFADLDSQIITTTREQGYTNQFNVPGTPEWNRFWWNKLNTLTNPDFSDEQKSELVDMPRLKTLYNTISELIVGYGFQDFPSLQIAIDEFKKAIKSK